MANRRLTSDELTKINQLLTVVRKKLLKLSENNGELLFAYRRKLYKELSYDERGKPIARRKLKEEKRQQQKGLCAVCRKKLPPKNAVLDRLNAIDGYTVDNTRLIHRECDDSIQSSRWYA